MCECMSVRRCMDVLLTAAVNGSWACGCFEINKQINKLKGLTRLWKSRWIYPKYMPKCSIGSTDHVCKFLPKNIALCGTYWCLKFPPRNAYVTSFCGSEVKNFGFGSALFTQFWRCKYGFVYHSKVQRTFKDDKIKWTVFTRPHAMKRHKSISPMLRNRDLSFGRLSTLKSNIFSARKLRVFWLILWYISITST